jgi:hypothetical protein
MPNKGLAKNVRAVPTTFAQKSSIEIGNEPVVASYQHRWTQLRVQKLGGLAVGRYLAS